MCIQLLIMQLSGASGPHHGACGSAEGVSRDARITNVICPNVRKETTMAMIASLATALLLAGSLHIRPCAGGGRGGGRLVSAQEKSKQSDVGVVRQLRVAEPQQPSAVGR